MVHSIEFVNKDMAIKFDAEDKKLKDIFGDEKYSLSDMYLIPFGRIQRKVAKGNVYEMSVVNNI